MFLPQAGSFSLTPQESRMEKTNASKQGVLHWLDENFEKMFLVTGLLSITLFITWQVIYRYIITQFIERAGAAVWTEELSRYIFIWISYLALSVAIKSVVHPGEHALRSSAPALAADQLDRGRGAVLHPDGHHRLLRLGPDRTAAGIPAAYHGPAHPLPHPLSDPAFRLRSHVFPPAPVSLQAGQGLRVGGYPDRPHSGFRHRFAGHFL